MNYAILCIFTPTGHTFTFRDVEIVCNNETTLQFNYRAMSDGRMKTATFPKATLCGWSTTPDEMKDLRDIMEQSVMTGPPQSLIR